MIHLFFTTWAICLAVVIFWGLLAFATELFWALYDPKEPNKEKKS